MTGSDKEQRALRSLAQQYGVQTTYTDVLGNRRKACEESILGVLKSLGAPVSGLSEAGRVLEAGKRAIIERRIEPVAVAWDGKISGLRFFVPQNLQDFLLKMQLQLESGETLTRTCNPAQCRPVHYEGIGKATYVSRELPFPETLPFGYHNLSVETTDGRYDCMIISAPEKLQILCAYGSTPENLRNSPLERPSPQAGKMWGVFLPLYSLHSEKSLGGVGDFGELERMYGWLDGLGGNIVGTLPFLAAFLDNPCEPSPYSPASRLFWNELYLDLEKLPEMAASPQARSLLESARRELEDQRQAPLIDYRRQMAARRGVLEELARNFFSRPARDRESFEKYRLENPALDDYARFRALGERFNASWTQWPAPQRDGKAGQGDFDQDRARYHLYAQWAAEQQIRDLAATARNSGPGLYLDLPLGIHPHSYDTWRHRGIFVPKVFAGAPPDVGFPGGQNWGFPPLHPEKIREDRYRYVIAYLGKMMRHAGVVRIDHAPGLHRIYWIPEGFDAGRGVYVHYRSDELYAIINLEALRNRCLVVGENLGTVPEYVNTSIARHNIFRMYVVQYELDANDSSGLKPVPANSAASLNTHDMPPFAGFLEGLDIEDRVSAGILDERQAPAERERRKGAKEKLVRFLKENGYLAGQESEEEIMRAALAYLASSSGKLLLVNLEDLWLEKRPQNLPGTAGDRPNWKHRAKFGFDEFRAMPEVVEVLKKIDASRKNPGKRT